MTGQFLTVDPAVDAMRQPYAYTANNPLQNTDPTGLCVGMDGTPQDRQCSQSDYFWAGMPGAINQGLGVGLTGFTDGLSLGLAEMLDPTGSCTARSTDPTGYAWAKGVGSAASFAAAALVSGGASAGAEGTGALVSAFWSGGEQAEFAARSWAAANGGVTLEMTEAGQAVARQTADMAWKEAKPPWDEASARFAEGTTGVVHVFQSDSVRLASAWAQAEYPALVRNGVRIMFHGIGE